MTNKKVLTSVIVISAIMVGALFASITVGGSPETFKPSTQKFKLAPVNALDGFNTWLGLPGNFVPISEGQAEEMESSGTTVHHMTLVAIEKTIALPTSLGAPGKVIAYTFNGTIPGPAIRVTQGDIVNATIINPSTSTNNHSIDNHGSIVSAANFLPTPPGTKKSYLFVATQAGLFEYHCEGNVVDLDEHVFRGMQGSVIIDPRDGYSGYTINAATGSGSTRQEERVSSDAKEVVLDFSEYYLTSTGNYNRQAMFNHNATFTYINGIPFGYDPVITRTTGAVPLHFNTGDHVRFFLINIGDESLNFHIVGNQLDRVDQGGVVQHGVQTFNLGGSNSAIADVKFDVPGLYVIVNHNYSPLFKGQFAIILVDSSPGSNPSNAVPPSGHQSIAQSTVTYTFGTPLVWDGISALPSNQMPLSGGGIVDTTN